MAEGRVVVIVPVFERPTAIVEALDSVVAQTRRPDALVIVDDGSRDATAARVEEWLAGASPSFSAELVRQSNRGVSAARNRGILAAPTMDWVAFLDSDDLWPETYLEAHLRTLSAHPEAVASTCDKDSTDVPTGRSRRVHRGWVAVDTTREIARRGPPGISNTVMRVSDLRAIGGFDEDLATAEDLDLMLRLSLLGPWSYVPKTSAHYRHRLGEVRGEAPSLGHAHADRRGVRARVLDAFAEFVGAQNPGLAAEIRDLAGRQWTRAGRQLAGRGRRAEAAHCFDRALLARPADLRARWCRLRLRFSGLWKAE